MTARTYSRRPHGYSLVEFMVAHAVGLLVLLAATAALLEAKSLYTLQAEQARVQEAGRFALGQIARMVRQSGLRAAGAQPGESAAAMLDGRDAHTLKDSDSALEAALPGGRNPSDILALYFSGAGQPGAVDCAGMQAGGAGASIFYVAPDAGGEAELRCKYRGAHGWSSDALVRGVDSFQVLYGVDTDVPGDGLPDRFMTASAIIAHDDALAPQGGDAAARARERNRNTLWKRVVALKVALLLRGAQNLALPLLPRYELFDPPYAQQAGAQDPGVSLGEADFTPAQRRRYRQVFSATIALRNR